MYQLEAEDARHTEYFYRLIDIYVYFNIRAWKTLQIQKAEKIPIIQH